MRVGVKIVPVIVGVRVEVGTVGVGVFVFVGVYVEVSVNVGPGTIQLPLKETLSIRHVPVVPVAEYPYNLKTALALSLSAVMALKSIVFVSQELPISEENVVPNGRKLDPSIE